MFKRIGLTGLLLAASGLFAAPAAQAADRIDVRFGFSNRNDSHRDRDYRERLERERRERMRRERERLERERRYRNNYRNNGYFDRYGHWHAGR